MRYAFLLAACWAVTCAAGQDRVGGLRGRLAGAAAQAPATLTPGARRAFLRYYAPVILKQADEDGGRHAGHDWITQAFFDGDRDLSNNKARWHEDLADWVAGRGHADWALRPTLYTALIEFTRDGRKSVVLLYHVYHAKQRGSIHDWERIELRLDDVAAGPGQGERLAYAVITEHSHHKAPRSYTPAHVNVYETPHGRHLLVWQAPWSGWVPGHPRKAELRYVESSAAALRVGLASSLRARVRVEGLGPTPVHYAFVPQDDPELVRAFGAQVLSQTSAARLASRTAGTARWPRVPRIRYELQDLADLWVTHLDPGSWEGEIGIRLVTAVRDEAGAVEVPASAPGEVTTFLHRARDDEDEDESRGGYPRKHWVWGTYHFDREANWTSDALRASGGVFDQHDYFAHTGVRGDGSLADELERAGAWLRTADGWWTPEQGGYDGRWEQLFAD
ncbi:MAG: hypothetical protein R3F62_16470 [Planctomycetota bacterium]